MCLRHFCKKTLELSFLVCFFLSVFRNFSFSLSYDRQLIRHLSFENTLPSHSLYYVNFLESISRSKCAMRCLMLKSACAGILYNKELLSCKILKCHLTEKSIKRTSAGVGWEFWLVHGVCPDGWLPFDHHCYFFNKTKNNWFTAKEQCEKYGAHLVEIESPEENTWIMETFLPPWNEDV
ncbi:C-type lectin domain family 6 member A-like [Saccostrea echinata]|uniref:C-type lectin domain family 6 member A-like n=1 Tax=Saccostrea echinata TaxID=191078 RepID=UPI002A8188D1|nr:C-type lectin domain family 6 member A-like [Saccostrea echinata]